MDFNLILNNSHKMSNSLLFNQLSNLLFSKISFLNKLLDNNKSNNSLKIKTRLMLLFNQTNNQLRSLMSNKIQIRVKLVAIFHHLLNHKLLNSQYKIVNN
jgi:hypothetical protein